MHENASIEHLLTLSCQQTKILTFLEKQLIEMLVTMLLYLLHNVFVTLIETAKFH